MKHRQNTMKNQAGKGLASFIAGLLLATIAIGAVLFFLSMSQNAFKPEVAREVKKEPKAPELICPIAIESTDGASPSPNAAQNDVQVATPSTEPVEVVTIKKEPSAEQVAEMMNHLNQERLPARAETAEKPTSRELGPLEILSAGSLEGAKEARQLKEGRPTQKVSPSANSKAVAGKSGGKVIVQMGAFSSATAAKRQLASVLLLGIPASIQEVKDASSLIKWRVLSEPIANDKVDEVRARLKNNGIDSVIRSRLP